MTGNVEGTAVENNQTDNHALSNEASTDPMIVAMREAEAELAKATDSAPPPPADKQDDEGQQEEPAAEAQAEEAPKGGKPAVMIPKERLDQALSERDRFKEQASYYQGIADTQKAMLQSLPVATQAATTEKATALPDKPDYDGQIAAAENAKLEAAQKYEDGDISLVEFEKIRVAQDRAIRTLEGDRVKADLQSVRQETTREVQAQTAQNRIESVALDIQAKHPYVDEIDQLPPAIRDGIWKQIEAEASAALAQKGINPLDGTIESRVALIQAKAALTDVYGPRFTGKQLAPAATSQTPTGKAGLSTKAQERSDKIDLANQQPPAVAATGSHETRELTEADIEKMSDDQIADLMLKAPSVVAKAVGFTKL